MFENICIRCSRGKYGILIFRSALHLPASSYSIKIYIYFFKEFEFVFVSFTLIVAVIGWISIVVMLMWMLIIEIPIAFSFAFALSDTTAKYSATGLFAIVVHPLWIRYTHRESVLFFSLSSEFFFLSISIAFIDVRTVSSR